MTIKLILTILCSALAAADVYFTMHIINKLGLADSEQNQLVRFAYKLSEKWAWVAHALFYAAFIALPWVFQSGGNVLGFGMLSVALGYAAQKNWKVYKRGNR